MNDLEFVVDPESGKTQEELDAIIRRAWEKTMEDMAPLFDAFNMEPLTLDVVFEEE